MKLLILFLMLFLSANANAWTSVAYGKSSGYVYTARQYESKALSDKNALKGCAEADSQCVILTSFTGNNFVVIARGVGGVASRYDSDLKKAEKAVMENCKKEYTGCFIESVYWDGVGPVLAVASIGEEAKAIRMSDDLDDAISKALSACKQTTDMPNQCKAYWYDDSFYYSYATPTDANDANDTNSFWFIGNNSEESKKSAITACEKGIKTCKITEHFKSAEKTPAPKDVAVRTAQLEKQYEARQAAKKKKALAQNNKKVVTSKTTQVNRLSCQNSCQNGSCIRTLPDGTKERWQAPRVFNPLSNNWEWDTTTNACGI